MISPKEKEKEKEEDIKEGKKRKKGKKHRKNLSTPVSLISFVEAKESDLNISAISKDTADKEVQIEPIKELKITTKKIVKRELITKKKFLDLKNEYAESFSLIYRKKIKKGKTKNKKSESEIIGTYSIATQTPKLRSQNKEAKKVHLNKYEIVKSSNFKLISNAKKNDVIKEKINEEEEENEESNDIKIYRIETLKNLFILYFNKKIGALQIIYLIKWKNLANQNNSDVKANKKFKKFLLKYPRIFAMKLLDFLDEYNDLKGGIIIIKNIFNKKTFKILEKYKLKFINKNIYHNQEQHYNRTKLACNKVESILRKFAGKYVFSLHKKKK